MLPCLASNPTILMFPLPELDFLSLIHIFLVEWEQRVMEARAAVLVEEARGSWLQRSWRPLVMLTFAVIVLVGTFVSLPILDDTSRFWDLLEIGLGGYVVGRSGEKMATAIFKLKAKKRCV